jgi:hypothetical protein
MPRQRQPKEEEKKKRKTQRERKMQMKKPKPIDYYDDDDDRTEPMPALLPELAPSTYASPPMHPFRDRECDDVVMR